jgi:integrase
VPASRAGRPRAADHEGKPVRLPSGRYRVQISLGGVRHSVTAPTAKEARDQRNALARRHKEQQLSRTPWARRPLREYLAHWLEGKRGSIEPSTWGRYRYEITRRLEPTIGDVPLGRLTADDVQAAVGAMRAGTAPFSRPVGGRTALYALATLYGALKQAARTGIVARNVAADVQPPKVTRTEARAFTAAEVERILGKAAGQSRALWLLALYSGLRLGELLGLPWDAIRDLGDGTAEVTVRQVLARDERGGVYLRDYPKSAAGRRTVRVPDFVLRELQAQRERQRGTDVQPEAKGLVFVSQRGGLLLPSNVWRSFLTICRAAGISGKVHPHMTRHSFASHLIAEGRPITEVSAALGHSSRTITLNLYAHALPETAAAVPDALTRAYGPNGPTRVSA